VPKLPKSHVPAGPFLHGIKPVKEKQKDNGLAKGDARKDGQSTLQEG
jgi:hypothetical protein